MRPYAILYPDVPHFILPKISSQGVMDAFWVTIEWLVISTMFDQMIICSPFISSSVQLINSKDNKSYLPKATRPNTRFHKIRPFVSGGLSAAVLFSASQGIKALYPLATLAFVMAMVFIPLPRISTKMTLLVLNGYFIGMPIVAGTIGYTVDLLVKYFSKSGDTDKPSTDTVPSDWVADAMLMFGSALPYVVGGFMASLALRYDHSKSSLPSALTLPAAPGEPVQIVNKRHLFRAPTFITALIALIGCMGTTIHFINQNAGMRSQFASEGLGLFLVVPVVSIAMLGCVGVRGNLREFWQYEEVWIPKKEEVTQISTATDVEAAGRASSEGEDEKDALITKAN